MAAEFAVLADVGKNRGPFWPQPDSINPLASKAAAHQARQLAVPAPKIRSTSIMSPIVMTDTEYLDRAEALLRLIEQACDRINDTTDADVDNQRVGGMITLTFANGSQIIINLQKPLQEVWMAARAGGFHYQFDGSAWMDTKGQGEFTAHLSRYASEQSGQTLSFSS